MVLTIIAVLWVAQSLTTYGLLFAYFQREYPSIADEDYGSDLIASLFMSLIPVSLISTTVFILIHRYHGFKFV